ncbi:MAG: Gfo/Idh/MocA family protein [Brevinema sp.]
MANVKVALIGAGNRWTHAYAEWIRTHKDDIELIAIAEKTTDRLSYHQDYFSIKEEACFSDWKAMLTYIKDKDVTAVIICTSDHDHYESAMACLEQNYHLLLEKPIAPNPKECIDIAKLANEKQRVVMVAHVLRYTPFFQKIRELIQLGEIGTIQSIQHTENIGYFHMAHSFVRGIWNHKESSNPIILAKTCHDLDILLYIMGGNVKAKTVAGLGSLHHFKVDNAPKGATKQCSKQCPVYETCPYSIKTYLTTGAFAKSIDGGLDHGDKLEEVLKTSRYGRCIYHCDNNVCDSMSTIIEFDNGVNASMTLSAFTDEINRTINIMGSHGQIRGNMEKDEIILYHFGAGEGPYRNKQNTTYHPLADHVKTLSSKFSGHGGGDDRFMEDFVQAIQGKGANLSGISHSIQSHLIAFALEESRVTHKMINMKQFTESINRY